MTKLQERFEEAEKAEPLPLSQSSGGECWWEASLKEFINYINRRYAERIWAFLDGSIVPDTLRLRLAPFTRKNEAVTFLVLNGTKTQVTVLLAHQHPVFESREEFDDFLVKFLRLPNFRASLAELIERNKEEFEGYLRFVRIPKIEIRRGTSWLASPQQFSKNSQKRHMTEIQPLLENLRSNEYSPENETFPVRHKKLNGYIRVATL
jgi:hypothetical protein